VLRRVVQGALTKQIAWELGVSERTVKADRACVMRKMGAATLPELVRLAEGLDGEPGPHA
jgi:FixJ family two-component response regulator